MTETDFVEMLTKPWGAGIVARREVGRFTGGLITGRTLANLDSRGQGPGGAMRVGRQVAYPATRLARWLYRRGAAMDQTPPREKKPKFPVVIGAGD